MDKLRLRFEKTGKAAYISHLDLLHVVQRIFLRAGTPLKYSEGFNPHAQISICVPLSVGTESLCELMDFRVTRDIDLAALPAELNAVSPEGIRFIECYEPVRKASDIKWLRCEGRYEYDSGAPDTAALAAFYARESIHVTRRTKRGEGVLELAGNLRGQFAAQQFISHPVGQPPLGIVRERIAGIGTKPVGTPIGKGSRNLQIIVMHHTTVHGIGSGVLARHYGGNASLQPVSRRRRGGAQHSIDGGREIIGHPHYQQEEKNAPQQ